MKKEHNLPNQDSRSPSNGGRSNDQSESIVERLLQQMSLEQPSSELDQSIFSLIRSRNGREVETVQDAVPIGGQSWLAATASRMVTTESMLLAVAAMIVGILLGSYLPGTVPELDSQRRHVVVNPGRRPIVYDKGFVLVDGKKPSRILVLENSGTHSQRLPVRREVVVPSIEF